MLRPINTISDRFVLLLLSCCTLIYVATFHHTTFSKMEMYHNYISILIPWPNLTRPNVSTIAEVGKMGPLDIRTSLGQQRTLELRVRNLKKSFTKFVFHLMPMNANLHSTQSDTNLSDVHTHGDFRGHDYTLSLLGDFLKENKLRRLFVLGDCIRVSAHGGLETLGVIQQANFLTPKADADSDLFMSFSVTWPSDLPLGDEFIHQLQPGVSN
nr:hypothetical protein HmN_000969600 [Hymenolepis microstoma]